MTKQTVDDLFHKLLHIERSEGRYQYIDEMPQSIFLHILSQAIEQRLAGVVQAQVRDIMD